MTSTDTRQQLLLAAQRRIQGNGYNGFSFRDLAEEVGIRSASIHYYFPTKSDLAVDLLRTYGLAVEDVLKRFRQTHRKALARIHAFIELFTTTLETNGQACLCGMLAAEVNSLPRPVQAELISLIQRWEAWLSEVIREGCESGEFICRKCHKDAARAILASLEGAMLVARAFGDPARLKVAAEMIVTSLLKPKASKTAGRGSPRRARPANGVR